MSPSPARAAPSHHADALSLRDYGASQGSHAHDGFQVLVGLQGVLELEVQGRGQRIAAGQGRVIAPGDRHDCESRRGSRCLVLDTTHTDWANSPAAPTDAARTMALARYLEQALRTQAHLARQHGPLLLLEAWHADVDGGDGAAVTSPRWRRPIDWAQLEAWTRQRLHQPLSVAELAGQAFLSPTQFAARCRRETGLSVMQWLRRQRLALAVTLRDGGLGVAATALRCGYQSPSALTAALRRQRGG